jgi:hypothetical protein
LLDPGGEVIESASDTEALGSNPARMSGVQEYIHGNVVFRSNSCAFFELLVMRNEGIGPQKKFKKGCPKHTSCRVARWFIFKPKSQFCVNFGWS